MAKKSNTSLRERNAAPRKRRDLSNHAFPTCSATGKIRYGEHKDATATLIEIRRTRLERQSRGRRTRRREQSSYRCQSCAGFHLSSWLSGQAEVVAAAKAQGRPVTPGLLAASARVPAALAATIALGPDAFTTAAG